MSIRKILLHGHIFKNAGTTFDWSLARSFGNGFVDHREDDEMRSGGAKYLLQYLEAHPRVSALSSHHLCCPLPHSERFELTPVFLLRHPVERIWSVYHFERGQVADTPGATQAKRLDLREYVLWRMRNDVYPTIRNFQVRFCSDLGGRLNTTESRSDLEAARHYILGQACFGLVEMYDQSMVLLEQELAARGFNVNLEYKRQNVSGATAHLSPEEKIREVKSALGSSYDLVLEKNSLDLEFHEFARRELARRVDAEPACFRQRLADFKERCYLLLAETAHATSGRSSLCQN